MRLTLEVWPNMPWGRLEAAGPAWNSWGDKSMTWCAERLAEYGYDGMDFIYAKALEGPKAEYEQRLRDLRQTVERLGIEVGFIGCHTTFVTPRSFDRDRGIQTFKDAIDAAEIVGASSVCTLVGDGYYDPPLNILLSRREAWAQCRDAIAEVAAYARPKGINVSIELLQGTILNRVELMEKMFEEVGAANLRVTLDAGTWYTTVKPFMPIPEAVARLGKLIDIVHVKDEVGLPTIVHSNHIWLGGGMVNFRELGEALRSIDFQGVASVEWEGWQVGGTIGVGEPAGVGLADFDRVAVEAKEFLADFGFVARRSAVPA
jgi:L-ribulose-5-phosphate 3-epimerase